MNTRRLMIGLLGVVLISCLLLPACSEEPASSPAPTQAPAATPAKTAAPAATTKAPAATTQAPAVTTQAPAPPKEPTILKFSYTMPKGKSIGAAYEWWAEEFMKRTDGRYKVETYPGSSLVSTAAQLDATRAGVCEIVMTSPGSHLSNFPLNIVSELPTLQFSGGTEAKMLTMFKAIWEFYEAYPELQAEYKDFKLLYIFKIDPSIIIAKDKEIRVPADFKGLRVGGTGHVGEMAKGAGAAPVFQLPPEAYLNMEKGVIDACFLTFGMMSDYKMNEIGEYVLNQPFQAGNLSIIMNWAAWNAMPAADQKLAVATWADAANVAAKTMTDAYVKGRKVMEDAGATIIEPTAAESAQWESLAEDTAIVKWRNDAAGAGVDDAMMDKVLAAWRAILAKYR